VQRRHNLERRRRVHQEPGSAGADQTQKQFVVLDQTAKALPEGGGMLGLVEMSRIRDFARVIFLLTRGG
jgi:hypothetical protein